MEVRQIITIVIEYRIITDQPIPRDIISCNTIKNEMSEKFKHSAYSGLIVKKYKEEYLKEYKSDDTYIGEKSKLSNLER